MILRRYRFSENRVWGVALGGVTATVFWGLGGNPMTRPCRLGSGGVGSFVK